MVIEGLRRLEYRGYDSAGIALVADGRLATDKRAGKLGQPGEGDRWTRRCRPRRPASATPGGRPTARPPTPTRTRTSATPAGSRSCTTGSSRTSPSLRPRSGVRRPRPGLRDRHRGRGPPAGACRWPPACDLTDGDAERVCQRLEGAFTLVAVDARGPVPRRRGPPQLARWWSASGDGENFLGSDVAAFIEHTRDALELGQDQVVTITRSGVERDRLRRLAGRGHAATTSTGTCRPPRRTATTGSCARRSTSSRGRWPTRSSAGAPPDGHLHLDEMRLSDQEPARRRQGHHHRVRRRRSTRAWSPSTRSSTGAGSRSRSSSASEFRYRDPILDYSTLVVAISQSGRDRRHPAGDPARATQRSKVLAICNTNGSTIPRESDAVIYTHAGPEIGGRLHQGLPDPAWSPATCWRSTWPRSRAPGTATRSTR